MAAFKLSYTGFRRKFTSVNLRGTTSTEAVSYPSNAADSTRTFASRVSNI